MIRKILATTVYLILSSCSYISVERDGAPEGSVDVSNIPDATPKQEPRSKYGNPASYEVFGKRYYVLRDSHGFTEQGIASWYGKKFHGQRTSSGETYDMYAMTAAHKTLPLPTYVEVKNLRNNKTVIVKVNDRGPFHENRIIDLSYTAARKLDIVAEGTGLVEIRAINPVTYAGKKSSVQKVSYQPAQGSFYIQVGAYSVKLNAQKMRQRLEVLGEDLVRINDVVLSGKTIHRVMIGPLYQIDTADNIVNQLAQLGINDHIIVTN